VLFNIKVYETRDILQSRIYSIEETIKRSKNGTKGCKKKLHNIAEP
jgi:hypothetical protein